MPDDGRAVEPDRERAVSLLVNPDQPLAAAGLAMVGENAAGKTAAGWDAIARVARLTEAGQQAGRVTVRHSWAYVPGELVMPDPLGSQVAMGLDVVLAAQPDTVPLRAVLAGGAYDRVPQAGTHDEVAQHGFRRGPVG